MDAQTQQLMRRVPSVDTVLKEPQLEALAAEHGRKPVADAVRAAVEDIRQQLLAQPTTDLDEPALRSRIVTAAKNRLEMAMRPYYRRAVNATGSSCIPAWGGPSCPPRHSIRFSRPYEAIR